MGFAEFINEYFVNPLAHPGQYAPYNAVNTIVFAIVAVVASFLILQGIRRLGVKIDDDFASAVMPFAFLGGIARVLADSGALPRTAVIAGQTLYPFVTPGIYLVVFLLLAAAYFIVRGLFPNSWKPALSKTGIALSVLALLPLAPLFKNYAHAGLILALALVGIGAYEALARAGVLKRSLFHLIAVGGQCLDGAATFVGVTFLNYAEQHVVANAIFGVGSPFLFFLLKIAFSLVVVYASTREPDSEEKNFVLMLVGILGLGPGLRDLVRLLAGV